MIGWAKAFTFGKTITKGRSISLNTLRAISGSNDKLLRKLDCAVIENLHLMQRREKLMPFDSIRGVFVEGEELYPGAGFHDKNHIQICIRNPNCIKGFFIPRQEVEWKG